MSALLNGVDTVESGVAIFSVCFGGGLEDEISLWFVGDKTLG